MLKDLVKQTADALGITQVKARAVLGVVLSTAERQGSRFATELFARIPGARTLSAKSMDASDAPVDPISRLIEQTPGGRRHVASQMMRELHAEGLGHEQLSTLLTTLSSYAAQTHGIEGLGHLGDLFGSPVSTAEFGRIATAA